MSTVECITLVFALHSAGAVNLVIHCCVATDSTTKPATKLKVLELEQKLEVGDHLISNPELKTLNIYLLHCRWDEGKTLDHW